MSKRLWSIFGVIAVVIAAAFVSVSRSAEARPAPDAVAAPEIPKRAWGPEELARLKRLYPDRYKNWKVEDGPMWRLDWGPELLARLEAEHPGQYTHWKVEWGPKEWSPENWPGTYTVLNGRRLAPGEAKKLQEAGTPLNCSDKLLPRNTCFTDPADLFAFEGDPYPQPVTCADLRRPAGCKVKPNRDTVLVTEQEKQRILQSTQKPSGQKSSDRTSSSIVEGDVSVQAVPPRWALLYDGYGYVCGTANCKNLHYDYRDFRSMEGGVNYNDKTSGLQLYSPSGQSIRGCFYWAINYEPWYIGFSSGQGWGDLRNYYGDNRDNAISSAQFNYNTCYS